MYISKNTIDESIDVSLENHTIGKSIGVSLESGGAGRGCGGKGDGRPKGREITRD